MEKPRHLLLWCYPATKVGKQDCFFNRIWYEDYRWLNILFQWAVLCMQFNLHFNVPETMESQHLPTMATITGRMQQIYSRQMLVWSINMKWLRRMSGLFRMILALQYAMLWGVDISKQSCISLHTSYLQGLSQREIQRMTWLSNRKTALNYYRSSANLTKQLHRTSQLIQEMQSTRIMIFKMTYWTLWQIWSGIR